VDPSELGDEPAVLECTAGGQHFGVLLTSVSRIVPVAELVALPEAEPWILGTLNLAGESVVVVDMTQRLLGITHAIEPSEYIVICHVGEHRIGLLVDDILSVEVIPPGALQHPGPGVAFAPYLVGLWHERERSLAVVEVGRIAAPQQGETT
jgi:chemotaxis signal transduction protein